MERIWVPIVLLIQLRVEEVDENTFNLVELKNRFLQKLVGYIFGTFGLELTRRYRVPEEELTLTSQNTTTAHLISGWL